jgi:hypothetical protein
MDKEKEIYVIYHIIIYNDSGILFSLKKQILPYAAI